MADRSNFPSESLAIKRKQERKLNRTKMQSSRDSLATTGPLGCSCVLRAELERLDLTLSSPLP